MNNDNFSNLTYNEITGEFEDLEFKDEFDLDYNWETGEFEDSKVYKEGEVPDYLLASHIAPPQEFVDLISGVAGEILRRAKEED